MIRRDNDGMDGWGKEDCVEVGAGVSLNLRNFCDFHLVEWKLFVFVITIPFLFCTVWGCFSSIFDPLTQSSLVVLFSLFSFVSIIIFNIFVCFFVNMEKRFKLSEVKSFHKVLKWMTKICFDENSMIKFSALFWLQVGIYSTKRLKLKPNSFVLCL